MGSGCRGRCQKQKGMVNRGMTATQTQASGDTDRQTGKQVWKPDRGEKERMEGDKGGIF